MRFNDPCVLFELRCHSYSFRQVVPWRYRLPKAPPCGGPVSQLATTVHLGSDLVAETMLKV